MSGTKAGVRNKIKAEGDRAAIAELYLQRFSLREIAAQVKLGLATVSRDLQIVRKEWQERQKSSFNLYVSQELDRLDTLERQYWEAWRKSQTEQSTIETGKTRAPGAKGEGIRAIKKTVGRDGNPAFLAGVMTCIQERSKLLGLYAPVKAQVSGPDGGPIQVQKTYDEYRAMDPAELARLYRESLN
jgi:hypothetical protein